MLYKSYVHLSETVITLVPANENYYNIFFSNKQIASLPIAILGVVEEIRRKIKLIYPID